tara:strand:- start:58 stop:618 length:561 start_codon:yes stop_codon:yes gene_type:complete
MLRRLALGIVLLSSIAYGQDYELYTGISMHEHEDIKYGYVVGANFIIKTKQDREYFNNIIFGFEHAGYSGKKNTIDHTNIDSDVSDCDCDTSSINFTDNYSITYRRLVRAISLNMGVEVKNNWYLMSGVTNYQNLDVYDGEIFSEYRVNHINAGVKKFIKTKHWIWSPTIMFNPNVVSFSIGVSYK